MAFPHDKRTTSFFERAPSFSLLYFSGAVDGEIPALLESCGYDILGEARFDAPFDEAVGAIEAIEGPDNTIVHKASYSVSTGTVLLDPEMVLGVVHDDVLTDFCAQNGVEARVVVWERVSETAIARHITGAGVQSAIVLARGEPAEPPINPPRVLLAQPGPKGLRDFLGAGGARVAEIFGSVSARAFKLDESGAT